MTTLVFPGQGSQKVGMGADLFAMFPSYLADANDILGYDLKSLCLDDTNQLLNLTQYTQPALFVVGALAYLHYIENNAAPQFVAGHSLGEYNALFAAGAFDFQTGLKLVKERGRLMSLANEGGMLAVIGLSKQQLQDILKHETACQNITIANYNSHTQTVLTGPKKEIESAVSIFEQSGARMVVPLNVSGAFHSSLMSPAKTEFLKTLERHTYHSPQYTVIANLSAKPYSNDSHDIPETLAMQMTHSVLWVDSIAYLLAQGETEFVELGQGSVLTGLIKRIRNNQ
jgi:polyketide biosynthesis malonyl-CoA-[acyl-carrier-protein] transacylase